MDKGTNERNVPRTLTLHVQVVDHIYHQLFPISGRLEDREEQGDDEEGEKGDSPINLCNFLQSDSIFTNRWTTMTDKVSLFPIIIKYSRA
jgi:hypothetical protein